MLLTFRCRTFLSTFVPAARYHSSTLCTLVSLLYAPQLVMMSFSSGSHAPGGAPEEGRVMEEVQATLRMQYIQEFYQTVRDHCFKMCITSPGSSLSSSDQKCLGRCMDRYQDATGLVTKAVLGMQGMQ